MPSRKYRLMVLAREFLRNMPRLDPDRRLEIIDCLLALPSQAIPDRDSLRWFTANVIYYFLGADRACPHNYRRAARFIDRWKHRWLVEKVQA